MEGRVSALLPKEMIAGLRMDLNRPFGNGIDDNGNQIIDESEEAATALEQSNQVNSNGNLVQLPGPAPIPLYPVNSDIDVNGDSNFNAIDQSLARQLYARNLYVMMLMLINFDPADGNAEEDARKVAQWAVNVVDFRDRDSIMTGFEYDVNPFNGWDVDGDLSTDEDSTPGVPPTTNIVWGCERPEMLITETLAFHDRRTENLSADNGRVGSAAPNSDDDYDQRIRPEGSLFVELFNPWTESESLPGEFYSTIGGHKGINLRATAGNSPVWRMIFVYNTHPQDPDDTNLPADFEIERSVYFIEPGGTFAANDDGERYYPDSSDLPDLSLLKPGRYAVVGPGTASGTSRTYLGFRTSTSVTTPVDNYTDADTRRIELTPSTNPDTRQVAVYGNGVANDLVSLSIQAPIAVVINPPVFNPNQPRRLSVSEPFAAADRYPVYTDLAHGVYTPPLNDPLDKNLPANMDDGTYSGYGWIYLQRLANPLQPYHSVINPYRVVDKAQVDLTSFNGLTNDSAGRNSDPTVTNNNSHVFYTRERGEDEERQAGQEIQPNNIWAVELESGSPKADAPNSNIQSPTNQHHMNAKFAHTLGYLNEGFGAPQADPGSPTVTTYNGSPPHPFPWLTWLNRPFLSEMEMMLVPKERSSQFLNKDTANNDKFFYPPTGAGNPYKDPGPEPDKIGYPSQPYGHLINFFYDGTDLFDTSAPPPYPPIRPNRKLHRLLEFVRVPSPFVGTELQGEPTTFSTGTADFHPPFNHICKRRDPGRVNLNTITSDAVWNGVAGEFGGPAWNDLVQSRRGDAITNMFDLNDALPTRFANPFRSFGGYYNVPYIPNTPPNLPDNLLQDTIGSEVQATMLRAAPGGSNNPLFAYNQTTSPINNTNRNPYFRYQELNRLGSTATNRSNVYAVWVTVGYFEVSPAVNTGMSAAQFAKIYPDGFQLGQELGSDTGDVTRHRSFYMIDRSIPVGFQRGEDLNAEDAILLRRFIE